MRKYDRGHRGQVLGKRMICLGHFKNRFVLKSPKALGRLGGQTCPRCPRFHMCKKKRPSPLARTRPIGRHCRTIYRKEKEKKKNDLS